MLDRNTRPSILPELLVIPGIDAGLFVLLP